MAKIAINEQNTGAVGIHNKVNATNRAIKYYRNGKLHRTDGPAVIYESGKMKYYRNGKLHRTNGPAVEYKDFNNKSEELAYNLSPNVNGSENESSIHTPTLVDRISYDQDLKLHKENIKAEKIVTDENKPAIDIFETKRWCNKDGKLHRDNDLPAIVYHTGSKLWYKNGFRHRDKDLPAVEYNGGYKAWYKNGFIHRETLDENGVLNPAIINSNDEKFYYLNDEEIDIEQWKKENTELAKIVTDDECEISSNGTKRWYKDGKLHRDNDLPAIVYHTGRNVWYKNGKLHRDNDLPAVNFADGYKEWYKNGFIHRETLDENGVLNPAIININDEKFYYLNDEEIDIEQWKKENIKAEKIVTDDECEISSNGTKRWYKDGKLHRDNDLPAIVYHTGSKLWYKNGFRHRENDSPVVEYNDGYKAWYKNGFIHRETLDENGVLNPAIINSNDKKYYYLDGKHIDIKKWIIDK